MKIITFLKVFTLLFFFLFFLTLNNILNDPNAILHDPNQNGGWRIPNLHYLKLKKLLNEPKRKILLTGTSRVSYIYFSNWISSEAFYNLGAPRKTFGEILYDLEALDSQNKLPEIIFIGIDEGSFRLSTNENRKLKMKLPYPIGFWNHLVFLEKYFLTKDVDNFEFIQKWVYNKPAKQFFDIQDTGETYVPLVESIANNDPATWINDLKFSTPMLLTENHMQESLDEFNHLLNFIKKHQIRYQFFFNPVHKANWLAEKSDELFEFKKQLALLTTYLDFSTPISDVSNNNFYWYDPAHFRSGVGDLIAQELLSRFSLIDQSKGLGDNNTSKHAIKTPPHAEFQKLKLRPQEILSDNLQNILTEQKEALKQLSPPIKSNR